MHTLGTQAQDTSKSFKELLQALQLANAKSQDLLGSRPPPHRPTGVQQPQITDPEKVYSRPLLIYLEELLRTLIESRIPSVPERSGRSQSHLYPPFFTANGNIPSFWIEEGVDLEANCHALSSGSPGACHLTSLSFNVL